MICIHNFGLRNDLIYLLIRLSEGDLTLLAIAIYYFYTTFSHRRHSNRPFSEDVDEINTIAYEIKFRPDGPIETYCDADAAILTKGAKLKVIRSRRSGMNKERESSQPYFETESSWS